MYIRQNKHYILYNAYIYIYIYTILYHTIYNTISYRNINYLTCTMESHWGIVYYIYYSIWLLLRIQAAGFYFIQFFLAIYINIAYALYYTIHSLVCMVYIHVHATSCHSLICFSLSLSPTFSYFLCLSHFLSPFLIFSLSNFC